VGVRVREGEGGTGEKILPSQSFFIFENVVEFI